MDNSVEKAFLIMVDYDGQESTYYIDVSSAFNLAKEYAKKLGVTYKTAWNWFKSGFIEGAYQLPSGTVIIPESSEQQTSYGVILYARTSSSQNKELLENQAKRLEEYALARGYKIKQTVKEFGSGLNDNRKLLSQILKEDKYDKIIVEHKDRLTRFGFNYI